MTLRGFLQAQADAGQRLHSLTVMHSGEPTTQLAVHPWRLERPTLVYSMTKTFTSAAFGIVWDQGLLDPADTLVELFPDLVDPKIGAKARSITVGHCLAMASGHTFDTISLTEGRQQLRRSHLRAFLATEPAGNPGETFCYNQLCSYALSQAIYQASGRTVAEIVRTHILDPLGAGPVYWTADVDGIPIGFSGLHISPMDMARFIGLLAADGVHAGHQLLPRRWLDAYAACRVATGGVGVTPDWAQGYGWHVWRGVSGHRADGAYGQFGLIRPELDAAVVITSATRDMQLTIDHAEQHLFNDLDNLGMASGLSIPTPSGQGPSVSMRGRDGRGGRLELTPAGQGWVLDWQDADGGSHHLDVGFGQWLAGRMQWPPSAHFPEGSSATVYTAGAGKADGSLEVEVAFVDTPHTAVLSLGDGMARWSWDTEPLVGPHPQQLSLPLVWDSVIQPTTAGP